MGSSVPTANEGDDEMLTMKGPEKMALLQAARAAEAQHRLVASAAQQEREARPL